MANKANLDVCLEIRRHLLGQMKCAKWDSSLEISAGIINEVSKWCSVVTEIQLSREERDTIQGISTYPPSFWRTIKATGPTMLLTLELNMAVLRLTLHRMRRADRRKQINKAVVIKEASKEAGNSAVLYSRCWELRLSGKL